MNINQIIKEKRGTIVDVRTPVEFMSGSVPGSLNIPLQEIPGKLEELKKMTSPLILCCASGGRSSHATQILSQHGIECYNGGSWMELHNYYSQKN